MDFFKKCWDFIGSNQIAVIVTVIGSIIGLVSIWIALEIPLSIWYILLAIAILIVIVGIIYKLVNSLPERSRREQNNSTTEAGFGSAQPAVHETTQLPNPHPLPERSRRERSRREHNNSTTKAGFDSAQPAVHETTELPDQHPNPLPERSRREQNQRKHPPYITTKAVTPPNFVGREEQLYTMRRCLENEESIALLGDRRIGKSSLLHTWQQQLREQHYPVFLLNGQDAEGASLAAFVQAIIGKALDANSSAEQAADELMRWAELTAAQHQQRKPLILVDECERIFEHCPPRFWERVRGGLGRILWVFASRQDLGELHQKYHQATSPLYNQLKTMFLGLLDEKTAPLPNQLKAVVLGLLEESAAEQLIQRGDFSSQQQALLREWAGRHPFYLQLLAQELDSRRQQAPQAALDAFKTAAQSHLTAWWRTLSKQQQQQLLNATIQQQALDSAELRSRGVLTATGQPFARILQTFLQNQVQERNE